MYHVSVVTLILVASDVDLLQSSSQSLSCSAVASRTVLVALEMSPDSVFVRKASVQTEDVKRKQVGNKTHMPVFFAPSLCPLQSLCFQNMLTDYAHVPDFFTLFHALKL